MPMPRKSRNKCLNCVAENSRPTYVYCSNKCQIDYQYTLYIRRWMAGNETGLQRLGVVSRHVKRFLREKYLDKCYLCGWSKINSVTGVVPLVADHIDGDWRNNVETNLRLICPNCDSLSATYAGLNRGNGRQGRKMSKRTLDARLLVADSSSQAESSLV